MRSRQNNLLGKQNSLWLNNLSEQLMRQQNYQSLNNQKNINNSKHLGKKFQPKFSQTKRNLNNEKDIEPIFESYLQIQQVESKEIPTHQLIRVEQKQKVKIDQKKAQKINKHSDIAMQDKSYEFLANISKVIKTVAVFQKPYKSISSYSCYYQIFTLNINDILQNIDEYRQYEEKIKKENKNFQYKNTQNHMPLSHHLSKISRLNSAFSIEQQPSPVPRQSISLFSRMMKPNSFQVKNKTHQNYTSKQKLNVNILQDSVQIIQRIYFSLLKFVSNIYSTQLSEQKQLEQLKSFLKFSLKVKIIQIIDKNRKQSNQSPYLYRRQNYPQKNQFQEEKNQIQAQNNEWSSKYITSRKQESNNHKKKISQFIQEYDLNQINISNQQITLFKENLILYTMIFKEIMIKSQKLFSGHQIEMINNLPSYKSQQTNFCSFPSQNLKSIFSFPSLQIRSKNLIQSKVQSNKSSLLKVNEIDLIFAQQMLIRKIKQNKNVFNRKGTLFITQINQDFIVPKSSFLQFMNLLYDVWLLQAINKSKLEKNIEKYDNQNSQLIFSSIYELVPSYEQTILFLVFVLKQIKYNLCCNLKKQKPSPIQIFNQQIKQNNLQNKVKSSLSQIKDKNSRINENFLKKSSLNEQIQEESDRTKRIKTKKINNKNDQQLQQTRNKYIDLQQYEQNVHLSENIENSNKNNGLKSIKKQNSSSKLALSRLYQSKLNNITKKTQKINQQVAITHLNLNKNASKSKLQNFIEQQSLINVKSKQLLMRSKNPTDHQQNLHILQLKQTIIHKNTQLLEKQKLIKKLIFMQQINQIDNTVSQKNIQTIYTNKIQNIKNQYKQKLKSRQQEIKITKQNLKKRESYILQVNKQRKIQSKLLQESNHIYNLKKWTIPEKDKQIMKKKYSQSLSNLKKGCYKQVYTQKNKQNIQQMSNITQREQSMSVLRISQQKIKPSKSLVQPQINLKENILNKLNNLQHKINQQNKSVKLKFFSQT